MTGRRAGRRVIAISLAALVTTACSSRESYAIPELPADYGYTLTSSCGERPLNGQYQVVVKNGVVSEAEPLGGAPLPDLGIVPTLDEIVKKANDAESGADVELVLDDAGLPVSLNIDHDDDVTDDEECYEVSNFVSAA